MLYTVEKETIQKAYQKHFDKKVDLKNISFIASEGAVKVFSVDTCISVCGSINSETGFIIFHTQS